MFIQSEATPNPLTMKFIPEEEVMGEGNTAFFTNRNAAKEKRSPLACALFEIEGVNAVFLGSDFITVTRAENAEWDVLKPMLLTTIMEHFVAGLPVVESEGSNGGGGNNGSDDKADGKNENEGDIARQIKELIETRVRPAVAMDGGDIIFHGFDAQTGIVQLEMHGACSGCPSSTITLKHGIENMLKHYVPEVQAVEAVEAVEEAG